MIRWRISAWHNRLSYHEALASANYPRSRAVGVPVILGFVGAIGLLSGIGLLTAWNIQRVHSTNALVVHTHAVQSGFEQLLLTLVDAETGQRGFIITGEARYLEPYDSATGVVAQRIDELRQLTADNREQTADLTALSGMARLKLDELAETIRLRRELGFDAAQRRVQTDVGKRAMDDMRAIVSRMVARENRLLSVRSTGAERSYGTALAAGAASTAVAIAALILLFATIRRSAIDRYESLVATTKEREYLRVTLMGIGDGVIVADREGRVSLMNPVAEALTGRRLNEAAGFPVTESFRIVNESTRAVVDNPITRALELGTVQGLANHTVLISADGTERVIDDSGAPIRDADGQIVGAVLVFRDVTEQRRSATALLAALQAAEDSRTRLETQESQLRDALHAKDVFLAVVSHELRNPITAVIGWARMLQGGTLAEERRTAAIAALDRSAQSLAKMIEDLLDMSRLASGKMHLSISEIELRSLVADVLDASRLSAESKGVTLEHDLSTHAVSVLGDRDRLNQVIWNLVVNAIKFTPSGGRVHLALSAEGSVVRLTIRDTGVGIAPDFLPHVFERFRQAERSNALSGLGLGLAITRHLVELHGGTINAASDGLGHGATFVVTLPAIE